MKKLLGVLAILTTILGTSNVLFAKSFSDVKNTKYEESVDILSELKIVDGYEDGSYKPTNSVKRSEMAKLLIVALGKEESAASLEGDTNFSDVKSNHWASGYINLASSLGLIKGYPDGTFRPDATVSYVEASTMLLRALDYGKELDSLNWPTGYMEKANSAGILENVSANTSADAAIRGNVANMLYNTLKANTRKVVASNNTGNVYGDGTTLIEKSFKNHLYIKSGTVVDIDIDDETITVEDEKNDRKVKIYYTDKSDIKKLFGREITCIYDKKNEVLLSFETVDKQTVKVIDVDEIEDDIIYDGDDEYELPKDDNILLLGITRYEDAEKAYITYNEKNKITYVVLEGKEDIKIGIVTDKNLELDDDKKGIEIRNTSAKYEELVLANSSDKVSVGDVILYTYNNDDEIVIKTLEDVDDSTEIESVSKTSIELEDEDKITFSSSDEYYVYFIEDSYVDPGELEDIDKQYDKATILKYNDVHFILVFRDSIDEEDIETSVSVSSAKKSLKTALTNAKKKKESSYTIVSFERLRDAIEYGEEVYDSSSASSARIQLATKEINEAMSDLKKVTTADKELRTAYSTLQSKITEASKLDSKDYTAASFKTLTTAITNAKKIEIESTTLAKVTTATNDIKSAMNLLVTNTSAEQIVTATTRLDNAIKDAQAKKESNYTATTYANLKKALTAAKSVDRTSASARELNNVAANLEAAIDGLVSYEQENYNKAKATLDKNLETAKSKNEVAYTESSWNEFEAEYDAILEEYKEIEDMTSTEVTALNKRLETAINKLVLKTDETLRKNSINTIQNCIEKAEAYMDTTVDEEIGKPKGQIAWEETNPPITWDALKKKINDAKSKVENESKYETKELQDTAADLILYITL